MIEKADDNMEGDEVIEVIIGATYRHYKGGFYVVLAVSYMENREKHVGRGRLVTYRRILEPLEVWTRPLSEFLEFLEHRDGVTLRRFTLISKSTWEPENEAPELMRELHDHIVDGEKLRIRVLDAPGPGGASHKYNIHCAAAPWGDSAGQPPFDVTIKFQKGTLQDNGINGLTQEALLALIIDRLRSFQNGLYACPENAQALINAEQCLHWLQQRTLARIRRGVEGTHTV